MAEVSGPEEARLIERLFDNPGRRVLDIKVSWGSGAKPLSREERAAQLNRALDQVESGKAVPLDFEDSELGEAQ